MFKLRMRGGFEAADAGLLLWKERAGLILLFFALPALAAAIAVVVLYNHNFSLNNNREAMYLIQFIVFAAVLWYLKPLFDRFALAVISKIFFNKNAGLKEVMSNFTKNFTALAGDLLWRRFSSSSLMRGAILPLRILERLNRRRLKERKKELQKGGLNFVVNISLICIALETALFAGGVVFIQMFFDFAGIETSWAFNFNVYSVLYFINFCIVESIYVSMSFAVYINSRVITEGWDLEILFRELAADSNAGAPNE